MTAGEYTEEDFRTVFGRSSIT